MKAKVIFAVACVLWAGIGVAAGVEQTRSKRDDIKRMMELTGAGKLGIQVMNQLVTVFKQGHMGIPEKFWTDFMAEVDPNELVEMSIPSYDKHFSHDEIKQMIAFYETALGQKIIKTQPTIMQECMIAGQEWGRKLGEKVAKKMQEQGYK